MKKRNTRKIVGVSMLGAFSFVLTFIQFPLPFLPPYLTMDFSDIPSLVGMFLYGPLAGISVAFLRNILRFITVGDATGFPIGELANFISAVSFMVPFYFILRQRVLKKYFIWAGIISTFSLTLMMSLLNWLILTPLYSFLLGVNFGAIQQIVFFGVLPFNLLKGSLLSVLFFGIYRRLYQSLRQKK